MQSPEKDQSQENFEFENLPEFTGNERLHRIPVHDFAVFVQELLSCLRVPENHSTIIADTIIDAHRSGKSTHGLSRLPIYAGKIERGFLDPQSPFSVVADSGTICVLDAAHGFGQVATHFATDLARQKSLEFGTGLVSIRRSNSFGAAGYFARRLAGFGLIGLVMSNAAPAISLEDASYPIFGTNPIALSFPSGKNDGEGIDLDMASSVVARSKIRSAMRNRESIPDGWAFDREGFATTSPQDALEGWLAPIGGFKGYGLALMVDALTGLLSGGEFAGRVKPLASQVGFSSCSHLVIAIDPHRFIAEDEYLTRIREFISTVRESSKPRSNLLPGDRSRAARKSSGVSIEVSSTDWKIIKDLAQRFQINSPSSLLIEGES